MSLRMLDALRCLVLAVFFFLPVSHAAQPAAVTNARALTVDADPSNWILHGRDHGEQRFSPLTQINAGHWQPGEVAGFETKLSFG